MVYYRTARASLLGQRRGALGVDRGGRWAERSCRRAVRTGASPLTESRGCSQRTARVSPGGSAPPRMRQG